MAKNAKVADANVTSQNITSALARPSIDERATYAIRGQQEQLIVAFLRREITTLLKTYGRYNASANTFLQVGRGGPPLRKKLEAEGWKYCGVDARHNPANTVDYVFAIDEELPEEIRSRGPFSLVICTEVLEHVADWRTALQNLTRLLAPGGHMLVTCPHLYPLHQVPYDFWRPTTFELHDFARRNGLVVVEEYRAGDGWDVLGTVLTVTGFSGPAGPCGTLLGVFGKAMKRLALMATRSRWLRRMLHCRGALYLSNVAVFRKTYARRCACRRRSTF